MVYASTDQRAMGRLLFEETMPGVIDPAEPGRHLPDNAAHGSPARETNLWAGAERRQRDQVEWWRHQAAPVIAACRQAEAALPGSLPDGEQAGCNIVQSLVVMLGQLGDILREQGKPECVPVYTEGYELALLIANPADAAAIAFNLGRAYQNMPAVHDLDQAQRWYQHSLELSDEHDQVAQGAGLIALGDVAYERFKESPVTTHAMLDSWQHFSAAVGFYQQALQWIPPHAAAALAARHHRLGDLYGIVGDSDRATAHYREAVRYYDTVGDFAQAGLVRFTVALILASTGHFTEALFHAQIALGNFETCGTQAAEAGQHIQRLVAWLERR